MDNSIISIVDGIRWPALASSSGSARLGVLFQLEQTQWWSEEKLRRHQFRQIDTLLRHCVKHVPYYKEALGGLLTSEKIDEKQWHDMPILTRDRLQQAGDSLRSQSLPDGHGKVSLHRTSGSTGKPVETLSTGLTDFFWDVFTLRDHLWSRCDLSGKLAVIRFTEDERAKPPHGMHAKYWGRATTGLFETGSSAMISIFTPIAEQVAWLQREAPNYILTHPSVLRELALYCQREAIQLPSLRAVETISEALPDGTRELCRDVWGVGLVDVYSTTELGYLALQCPEHDHYHVQSEGVLLEVLDDEGKPCKPGEIGRVVVTNLHNYAFPLIRYEVGDYAEVGDPCACGRGLPVLKRIKGRYRNILMTASGERRYPQLGIQDLYKIAPVQQFQAVQLTISDIEVRLVLPRQLQDDERESLTARLHDMMGSEFDFDIQQVDSIQRSASGKYEEFISML